MLQSTVTKLARLIREDVARRSLIPGDAYLTDREVGEAFNVHVRTASRAMRMLADQRVLVRQRGAGTFVGPESERIVDKGNGCLYVLVGSNVSQHFYSQSGRLLAGFRQELPNMDVHFRFLPPNHAEQFAEELLNQRVDAADSFGLVLLGCPRPVQELIAQRRLPAVVFGSTFATASSLVSLDRDWYETGRLEARWLIENGHRRLALVMHDHWLPGDNRFHDGVSEEIGRASLEPGSLVIRSLPADDAAVAGEVELLLDMNNGPTGFMCQTSRKAELVKQLAEERKLKVPSEIGVIFDGDELTTKVIALPQVCARTSYVEQVRQVAMRLRQLLQGEEIADMHVVVPVELLKPRIENGHSSIG